jgi:hypothetical protein
MRSPTRHRIDPMKISPIRTGKGEQRRAAAR